jgi:hypothetical protein
MSFDQSKNSCARHTTSYKCLTVFIFLYYYYFRVTTSYKFQGFIFHLREYVIFCPALERHRSVRFELCEPRIFDFREFF